MSALFSGLALGLAKTYSPDGFYWIVLVVFGLLISAAACELVVTRKTPPSPAIGHFVNGFVLAYPVLAFVFAVLVGAMIAHFFIGTDPDHEARKWLWSLLASVGIHGS